jgi:N-acyl-D-amino-acid deacylase
VSASANERAGAELHLFGPERCEYERRPERLLANVAAAAAETPAETVLRLFDETNGRQVFAAGGANAVPEHVEEVFRHPGTLVGLGDAGAHVTRICDSSMTTYVLGYWHRERGALSLAEAVRRLSSEPADVFGIPDRGRLVPGAFADLNVIDLDDLAMEVPEFVLDLPAGAGRWTQLARGYQHTFVNGQAVIEGGRHTGRLPGRVVRG